MSSESNSRSSNSLLSKLENVGLRLKLCVLLMTIGFVVLGYKGISGMQTSSTYIEDLYTQGMLHTVRTGQITDELGNARSALLLAFQHQPGSKFAHMHDHPIEMHIEQIKTSLDNLHRIVDQELMTASLNGQELTTVKQLAQNLEDITNNGFLPALKEIEQQDFNQANLLLLTKINPLFQETYQHTEDFLNLLSQEGKINFELAEANTSNFIVVFSIIAAVSLVFITMIAFVVIRRVNHAVESLQKSSKLIASGDLTQRITISGQDEFANIAFSVNHIVENFQHVVQTNRDSISQLAASSEENAVVVNQAKQSIVNQLEQITQVAAAINQFTATVHEVAQSANMAAMASDQADLAANNGNDIVNQCIVMMEQLSNDLQQSVEAMHTLAEHSAEIGSVVDVIEGISEQTNLLALNAAIEAARAGEQGRGFAVVADEVRTLASRTQASTKEIMETIQRLQQCSTDSMQKLENGAENASRTVEKVIEAGASIAKIKANVDEINAMNTQIATAAEEQSLVTEDISANISAISIIASQTAEGAEQSSEATMQLAKLAENLREEIDRYRI